MTPNKLIDDIYSYAEAIVKNTSSQEMIEAMNGLMKVVRKLKVKVAEKVTSRTIINSKDLVGLKQSLRDSIDRLRIEIDCSSIENELTAALQSIKSKPKAKPKPKPDKPAE